MKQNTFSPDHAVSPVVGVMLMLVVVIIIAAVTSAFGGGLMQTDAKAPQATIRGEYSQYYGLTMTHIGGDSLETKNLQVLIRPSEEFGMGQSDFGVRIVKPTTITNGKALYDVSGPVAMNYTYWLMDDGTAGVFSWKAGESMYIKGGEDLQNSGIIESKDWPPCYNEEVQGGQSKHPGGLKSYCYVTSLNNQINVGNTVYLEILTKDGKMISSTPMIVEP